MAESIANILESFFGQGTFADNMESFFTCVCEVESDSLWDVAFNASLKIFLHVYPMLYQYIGFLPFSNVIGLFVFFNLNELSKLQNLCPYLLESLLLSSLLRYRLKDGANGEAWNTAYQIPTEICVICVFLAQSVSFYVVQDAKPHTSDASFTWVGVMFLTKFSLYKLFFNRHPLAWVEYLHKLKYYGKIPVISSIAWWYYSLIVYSNITMKPVKHMQAKDLLCPNDIKDWRLTLVREFTNENAELLKVEGWSPWVLQTLFLGKYDIQRMKISFVQMLPDFLLIHYSWTLKTTWEDTCKLPLIKTLISNSKK
jgi:hypothetical protein